MRTAKLVEPYRIEVMEVPEPEITEENQVKVQVKAVGICGTDLHTFKGERDDIEYPRIMGHELSGLVVETGKAVSRVKKGDHVVFDPVHACGQCRTCKRGHGNVCLDVKCFGVQMDGGFQDYIVVTEDKLYTMPDNISYECGALAEPFSIAANIIARAGIEEGDRVVIFGSGTIGISVLQAVKKLGNAVLVSDIADAKLAMAKDYGADAVVNSRTGNLTEAVEQFSPGGADVLIDAVGTAGIMAQCVKLAAPCGRIVEIGFDPKEAAVCPINITKKELTISGSRMNSHRMETVVQWLKDGTITEKMISRVYALEDIEKAFKDTLAQGGIWLKTMIRL